MKGNSIYASSILFLGLILMISQVCHGVFPFSQLKVGFYQGKCGANDVEKVIFDIVKQKIANEPDTVSDLVRLSFHDCFVRAGGQRYEVETGRRDGVVSLASEAQANLPPPDITIPQSIILFHQKGLTIGDMVTLLGGHTVGTAHCRSFKNRLYNYQNTQQPDPRISPPLLQTLRDTCPLNSQDNNEAFLDQTPNSHFTIDNAYYKQILAKNGTLEIDANLASSLLTKFLVFSRSSSNSFFLDDFGKAMTKMARIGVLTGSQGEIRKNCGSIN